ncbi:MAG: hypothetical protein ABI881_02910 [Betaproteobacteria bacterium]
MRAVWLSLIGIVVCGGIGGVAGWSLATFFDLTGVAAALVALFVAALVAAALWTAGIALHDWRRRARDH